jgi:hypothetical protein
MAKHMPNSVLGFHQLHSNGILSVYRIVNKSNSLFYYYTGLSRESQFRAKKFFQKLKEKCHPERSEGSSRMTGGKDPSLTLRMTNKKVAVIIPSIFNRREATPQLHTPH